VTNPSWAEIARQVESRAGGRCEYCRLHQDLQGATFRLEHIIPSTAGGSDDLDNLAWAWPGCNLHKSDRQHLRDPESNDFVPMFHPRRHIWSEHFQWDTHILVGRTPVGRALIDAFDLNNPRRLRIRKAEESFDLFPPDDDLASGR
jgi:HNH endonuclease